ncbi:MAG: prepilin peptidase [Longimicrobiales bacterium]|nr:prepilin peptidase [Longimicrobiales bacterium]
MNAPILLIAWAGMIGLAVGSFLNVCTLRWPEEESVVRPPSRCPSCGAGIAWYDNIPVVSWLLLRGRCRRCDASVSAQYPSVEFTTGLIWAGMVAVHGVEFEALRGAVFLTILFGIAITDARFYIIPDEFSIGGTVLGLALAFAPGGIDVVGGVVGAAVGYGGMWLVGRGGTSLVKATNPDRLAEAGVDSALGGGDVKMMAMVGAFLGWSGVLLTVFLGSVLALIVFGVISAITKRLIPLGIFLAMGAAVTYGWGGAIIAWYRRSILGA